MLLLWATGSVGTVPVVVRPMVPDWLGVAGRSEAVGWSEAVRAALATAGDRWSVEMVEPTPRRAALA
ncbi:MAG: hypothetical protein HY320_13275 [Armatimonadetes bacterium]|nr:hypothetical protein [Armatimonadota bacterium]